MEPENVKADLQSLRKLYGLLQLECKGDDASRQVDEILDERARLVFKDLLDAATEKTLETHTKSQVVGEAESRVSNSGCYNKAKESVVIPKLHSPVSPYTFKSTPIVGRRNSIHNLTGKKDELSGPKPPPKPKTQEITLQSSKASIPSNRRKRCRVCQQHGMQPQSNAVNQGDRVQVKGNVLKNGSGPVKSNVASLKQKSIQEVKPSSACASNSPSIGQIKNKPNVVRKDSPSIGQIKNKPDVVRKDISSEIAKSIRRIDSGTSNLSLNTAELSNFQLPPKHCSNSTASKSKAIAKVPSGNVKAGNMAIAKVLSGNMKAGNMAVDTPLPPAPTNTHQHGPRSNINAAKLPPRPRIKPLNQMAYQKVVKSRPSRPPRQVVVKPTLIDAERSRTSGNRRTRLDLRQPESELTSSSVSASPTPSASQSSSSWTNQQSSNYRSDTDNYSTNTDESNSYSSSTGSPSSRSLASMASNSSSASSDSINSSSSPNTSYRHQNPKKAKAIGRLSSINSSSSPNTSYRHQNPKKGKAMGRLRRIKNKLGFIFHHHHHHHHHHHDDESSNDDAKRPVKATHSKHSAWKNLHDIFGSKNRKQKNEKLRPLQKDDKVKKVQKREPQLKHLQKLVGGLRKQVRRSKKTKPSKGLGTSKNGGKKKLHWWQMLKRPKGVKIGKKGRVKLGLQTRKQIRN